jgi:hypothetical protein
MARETVRTLRFTYKDNDEGHAERDHHVTLINNRLKLKYEHDAMFFIFEKGIATILEEIAKSPDATPEEKMAASIKNKILEVNRKEAQWASLSKLYDSMSADDFEMFCKEFGVSMSAVLEWRDRKANDSRPGMVRKWLNDLLRDGNPVKTDAIKQMALESGIISPEFEDSQWQYIRVLASREGFTSSARGCWQRKNVDVGF